MYEEEEKEVEELEDDYDHNDGVLSHHVESVLYISVWPSGVAQSNTHLNTMTVKDEDGGGGGDDDNDEDDEVNDDVHSQATRERCRTYLCPGRQEWPSPTRT